MMREREHLGIGVQPDDGAGLADDFGHCKRQCARAAGHIQHAITLTHLRLRSHDRAPLRKQRRHELSIIDFRRTAHFLERVHDLVSILDISRSTFGGCASAWYPSGMVPAHDHTSWLPATSSTMLRQDRAADAATTTELPVSCKTHGIDPLSDVLRTVKLTGALFFLVDASFPWGVEVPRADAFSSIILPRAQHVVSYHVILQGTGWANIQDVTPALFEAGDVLVFPHRSEEHTSELQSLMRISYAVFCLKTKNKIHISD